jgi:ketosteroid isomerase-like protein
MSEEAISVAIDFVRAINQQDPDMLASMMTPDHRFIDSLGHSARGWEGVTEGWRLYFQMVPDYRLDIEETYVQEGSVVMLGMARGTYSHAFEDVQAMGMPNQMEDSGSREPKRWQTPAAVRARVEDGKVSEWRIYADNEPLRRLMKQSI